MSALRTRVESLAPSTRGWMVFGGLLVVTGAFLLYETRGTTLWFDEWVRLVSTRGHSAGTFLRPDNQHLSLVPILIYKLLFATAGIGNYAPYRVIVIGAHLICSLLLFVYASRRVGSYLGLIAAGLFLLFGPGWQTSIWPIQVAWIIPVTAGVAGLLLLDRRDRVGDVATCVLAAVALASSGIGIAVALGLSVDVLGRSDRRRRAWVVVVPLALFAIWWVAYQSSTFHRHNVVLAPLFVAKAAAGTLSALFGLEGEAVFVNATTPLIFGVPLLLAAVVIVGLRLRQLGRPSVRLLSLFTMALSFWILTALARASSTLGYESRYIYVGALFIVLIAVELARGVVVPPIAKAIVGVLAVAIVVSNLGAFREGGRFLRDQARLSSADAAVLDLARPVASPGYLLQGLPGYPLVRVSASQYYSAEKAFGTPALSQAQLAGEPEFVRASADQEFARIHDIRLFAPPRNPSLGAAPAIGRTSGGSVVTVGACQVLRPASLRAESTIPSLEFMLPTGGVLIRTSGGGATVSVRRFADEYPATPQAEIVGSATGVLRIRPDLSPKPWHVRVGPAASATVCGLS